MTTMTGRQKSCCFCMALLLAAFFTLPVGAEPLPGPCELFTLADAEALFGEPVGPGMTREGMSPAGQICRYTFQKGPDVYGVTLKVSTTEAIAEEGFFDSAQDVFERQVRARKGHEEASKSFMPIECLGEGAFWEGTALRVLQDDILLYVEVVSPLEGSFGSLEELDAAVQKQNLAHSIEVAETVLARLEEL